MKPRTRGCRHRDVPGQPAMFGTTREFLDYFGLKKLDDLPPLSEIRDLDDLNPELGLPEATPQVDLLEELAAEDTEGSDEPLAANDADEASEEPDAESNVVPITRSESGT